MVVFYNYCFWFSLRLGSILIGLATTLKAGVILGFNIAALCQVKKAEDYLDKIKIDEELLIFFKKDLYLKLTLFATYWSALLISCICMITGSYQCKPTLIYPFLFLYAFFVTLIMIIFGMVCYLLVNLVNTPGLHLFIVIITAGLFILLYYLYTWLCVYSLIQVINEIRSRLLLKRNMALLARQNQNYDGKPQKEIPILEIGSTQYQYRIYKK